MTIQNQQIKYVNFCGVALQYTLIDGVFWLNATQLLNLFLKISIVQINKLKEAEHKTLDGASATQVFVPFALLSLTVQKILIGKAEKLPYFDEVMENGGGIEKLNQMLHHSNNMVFHTVESLIKDLDAANERSNSFENLLSDSEESVTEWKRLYDAQAIDHLACANEKDAAISQRDELAGKLVKQAEVLNGCILTIAEHVETIETKNTEIERFMGDHNTTIEKLNADHEAEKAQIIENNEENAAKVAEENAAAIEQLNADHEEVLKPLLERSKLRKFLLGRDMPLYVQMTLQVIAAAFMFALIADHYKFTNLPDFIGVIFQSILTLMLPISYVLFSLRKKNGWLYVVGFFEILVANHQTHLFDPLIKWFGLEVHFVESVFVTFFITILGLCFGSLTAERESNKALLVKPKE
jgi:prophage antirepressor-like protein